jgi:uncharacterized membrane protein YfcA
MDLPLIGASTLVASAVGTLTGFGTSSIMVPVLVSFYPLPQTLFDHPLVRRHLEDAPVPLRRQVAARSPFRRGSRQCWEAFLYSVLLRHCCPAFLLAYVGFVFAKGRFAIPQTTATAVVGGGLYGLSAGIFGVGGAVRGAFLSAYNLPKDVYIFTAGAIGLLVDTGRLTTCWWEGAQLSSVLWWGLLVFIPASFAGAKIAERIVERIPQDRFRTVVAAFLGLIALKLLLFPYQFVFSRGPRTFRVLRPFSHFPRPEAEANHLVVVENRRLTTFCHRALGEPLG